MHCSVLQLIGGGISIEVCGCVSIFNYLLEEMSRCNCFSLQLLGGGHQTGKLGYAWVQDPASQLPLAAREFTQPSGALLFSLPAGYQSMLGISPFSGILDKMLGTQFLPIGSPQKWYRSGNFNNWCQDKFVISLNKVKKCLI